MADPNKSPEEVRRDISLPDRGEEVIVNSDAQKPVTNSDNIGNDTGTASGSQAVIPEVTISTEQQEVINKERGFEEGLADDSDTIPPND